MDERRIIDRVGGVVGGAMQAEDGGGLRSGDAGEMKGKRLRVAGGVDEFEVQSVAADRGRGEEAGLGAGQLYEQRDLKPTIALDALVAGAAAGALGLDPERTSKALFTDARSRPLSDLILS